MHGMLSLGVLTGVLAAVTAASLYLAVRVFRVNP
jgi:hypothetical protein